MKKQTGKKSFSNSNKKNRFSFRKNQSKMFKNSFAFYMKNGHQIAPLHNIFFIFFGLVIKSINLRSCFPGFLSLVAPILYLNSIFIVGRNIKVGWLVGWLTMTFFFSLTLNRLIFSCFSFLFNNDADDADDSIMVRVIPHQIDVDLP